MSENPPDIDQDLKDEIDAVLRRKKKERKPKNCDTCSMAYELCDHCHPDCPDFKFGTRCGHKNSRLYLVAIQWREFGGKGDCPAWAE